MSVILSGILVSGIFGSVNILFRSIEIPLILISGSSISTNILSLNSSMLSSEVDLELFISLFIDELILSILILLSTSGKFGSLAFSIVNKCLLNSSGVILLGVTFDPSVALFFGFGIFMVLFVGGGELFGLGIGVVRLGELG